MPDYKKYPRSGYPRSKESEQKYPDAPAEGFIEKLKDMTNSRADMKTGEYYIKGKVAHRDEGGMEYESDPELSGRHNEYR